MSTDKFKERYRTLNAAQKQAVDHIDGPLMVVAGPGTGKTELISMRVANILRSTDALAQNILCLTFTESGANAMRQRLVDLMGKDAYHVAVHTFHSFGGEVIDKYQDYFYSGAHFRPADDLSTHQILTEIFSRLPPNNPLSSRMNGEFSFLKNIQHTISDFKKSGLTPDEIQRLIKHNLGFVEYGEPIIRNFFASPMHKNMLIKLDDFYNKLAQYQSLPTNVPNTKPLSEIFLHQLSQVIENAHASQKVTSVTAWRNQWFEKNKKNEFIFKDTARSQKLMAASHIYTDYLNAMQAASLYDYDDMILRLVHALEVFPDLKYNLQEQYQYLLVDEFQDTNGAQMRILNSLSDNPVNNDQPNLMVVGDDDQAIYSFQGAEVSNIMTFYKNFNKPKVINLRKNYRSSPLVLRRAREVITQSDQRLENLLETVDKTPVPTKTDAGSTVVLTKSANQSEEYMNVANAVAERIKKGQALSSIALLARSHRDIQAILPYLAHYNIASSYEHQENILEDPPIKILVLLARIVVWINAGKLHEVNARLPEVLSHPAWGFTAQDLWQLSLEAYKNNQTWLELMQEKKGKLGLLGNFLIQAAYHLDHQPLEQAIDQLYGLVSPDETGKPQFSSPLGQYFFAPDELTKNPNELIKNIHSLSYLRQLLRDWRPDTTLSLKDFVEFIDKTIAAHIRLNLHNEAKGQQDAVLVMTAHKAKGLEFESVFIINATDQTWGGLSRGRPSRLTYPANLPIAPVGENEDERLRLFFVAMTRAKRELLISYSQENHAGKALLQADFLQSEDWLPTKDTAAAPPTQHLLETAEVTWKQTLSQPTIELAAAIKPILDNYRLSATHLNNFLDVASAGPRHFVLENLLHFPKSLSPPAALGLALHATLKGAHDHVSAHKDKRPLEDILYDFETNLARTRLAKADFEYMLQKGSEALQAYLAKRYDSFTPELVAERNFNRQGVVVNSVKLTGVIDVLRSNKAAKTIQLFDYKTGKPAHTWNGRSDWEKIKLHRYRQQLLFYKLLIENSTDYRGFTVEKGILEFIEPDSHNDIIALELDYDKQEIENFKKLITAVWQHIMQADFPDISHYPQSYKGILAFEKDLLEE